jgi:hypothetical protein
MQIERSASIIFGDASIIIREQHPGRMVWADEKAWERQYRNEVLKRMSQLMRRLGWTCVMPAVDQFAKKQYGHGIAENSARNKRLCHKGDLKGEIDLSGSCLKLEMFQNVNAPRRPDHDGRYESNKEALMPYLLRLEMERTRRRIRDYLCNVFSGYHFDVEWMRKHDSKVGPGRQTAIQHIQAGYEQTCHFKGVDWDNYKSRSGMSYNLKSADGKQLEHGQTVWFAGRKGRWMRGTALYNINNMWWVVLGPYDYTNEHCGALHTAPPADLRKKQNDGLRRKRLEGQLNIAIGAMNFERAKVLRDIIYPPGEPIFCLWHSQHEAYHCAGFSGYTKDQMQAGKFTRTELEGWGDDRNVIVPFGARAA